MGLTLPFLLAAGLWSLPSGSSCKFLVRPRGSTIRKSLVAQSGSSSIIYHICSCVPRYHSNHHLPFWFFCPPFKPSSTILILVSSATMQTTFYHSRKSLVSPKRFLRCVSTSGRSFLTMILPRSHYPLIGTPSSNKCPETSLKHLRLAILKWQSGNINLILLLCVNVALFRRLEEGEREFGNYICA